MGKSDETHRCDVQKIAEEKYITQKAASKRAVWTAPRQVDRVNNKKLWC